MPFDIEARKIVRMPDYTLLIARIRELALAQGMTSDNEISLKATGKRDAIRGLQRGNVPGRERLRAFARLLGCELEELEKLAPDVRVDSRADAARIVLDALDSVPEGRVADFVEIVEASARAIRR